MFLNYGNRAIRSLHLKIAGLEESKLRMVDISVLSGDPDGPPLRQRFFKIELSLRVSVHQDPDRGPRFNSTPGWRQDWSVPLFIEESLFFLYSQSLGSSSTARFCDLLYGVYTVLDALLLAHLANILWRG